MRKHDGNPVFLNVIGYQPLEPGQGVFDPINESRLRDDLRRFSAYKGGTDPVILRIYYQPNASYKIPKFFYDELRELGFWIIRDIYFGQNFCNPNLSIERGYSAIDSVIKEVKDANALDTIFAWEIGNEFQSNFTECWNTGIIKQFIEKMCSYLKTEIALLEVGGISNWVTWASYPPYDPLYTDGYPMLPQNLDYISYNIYSYHPEQIRDHQAGPVTGTPYQGYLDALKKCHISKPLVISEIGYSDSRNTTQDMFPLTYPTYRYGGLNSEQVAEGLVDRYWDCRLLGVPKNSTIKIAGFTVFEWNDEWWKGGVAWLDEQFPEEHFGLGRFVQSTGGNEYQLRYKLQQEVIHDLYTLKFDHDIPLIEEIVADSNFIQVGERTQIQVAVSDSAAEPIRIRWEASMGYIIGNGSDAVFYSGEASLGPVVITVVVVDANNIVDIASTPIMISTAEPACIEILTCGTRRSSGRVKNVDLSQYKLICYLHEKWRDTLAVKPYFEMKSMWINKEGYWWTPAWRNQEDDLYCWLVPKDFWPNDIQAPDWRPDSAIAEASTAGMHVDEYKDEDNDLLLDEWEIEYFANTINYNRLDDPDEDMANNLMEFLKGMDPNKANDIDGDRLWDGWEYCYFGTVDMFDANDDPDNDGLTNFQEQDPNMGTHPCRISQDKDQDRLPDLWENFWFGHVHAQDASDNFDGDYYTNLEEYELGLNPIQ